MHQNGSQNSRGEDTGAVIQSFHDAFNRHDVNAIMALMTEDCVFENTYPPPNGERYQGQESVRTFWEQLFVNSPEAFFEVEELFACEDRGIIRWRYRWGPAASAYVRGVDILRVHDGKVAEKLSYVKG